MLLDKSRTLKIADFGVARIEASNPHDMTGETGTLGYMAPEVHAFFSIESIDCVSILSCEIAFASILDIIESRITAAHTYICLIFESL